MKNIKTNELAIVLHYEKIIEDFSIIKFATSEKYIKYGALFLDEINLETKAKSIVFEDGNSFYALYDKDYISKIDISKKLQSLKNCDSLSFNFIDTTNKLQEIPKHLLSQLLINSISNPKHNRFSFNNLTGKLYLFNPENFERSKTNGKNVIFKIIGLEFKINNDISLELNVKTFSNTLLSKKISFDKNKFTNYAKYTFVNATGTLKRVLNSDSKVENQYILRQTSENGSLKKSTISFLNFESFKKFQITKIGVLKETLVTIENKLSKYIEISFVNHQIENIERFQSKFRINKTKLNIKIIDLSADENGLEISTKLISKIKESSPLSSVKIASRKNRNGFNIILINNKKHYEKYNLKDPYKSDIKSQYITVQDFKTNSKASINTILKELIIKNDIQKEQISIIDWESFNFKNDWIFGTKEDDNFYFITIKPTGNLSFEKLPVDFFNQNEFNNLCEIFNDNSNTEFIVKDNLGNTNSITKTKNYTLPEFDEIHNVLFQENEAIILTQKDAEKYIRQDFKDDTLLSILEKLKNTNSWNKENLLKCFSNRNDKKKFANTIKSETGEILKSYFRDQTIRYDILDSQLDIHQYKEKDSFYYFVGVKGTGIQQEISRASVIREIKIINDSDFIFNKLLPLMNVDFVKNGQLTALPFPLKYLREWIKTN
ncbi:hypothetical protein [Tenacibaculum finnmarkense]|uniref:hypothetical protein n=1 Tax=Tenacibaculum finnmarkense TaxID=2781243 RepID=UPI001EFA5BD9|nr:hypothetical protein [Tenacibaculum finnmarkense]MCG8803162.1 hypothetical protein [Tenacibaculum finnmarkense]MCG8825977.1 hypothetical protein [Tenacibaculum finnmarkense]